MEYPIVYTYDTHKQAKYPERDWSISEYHKESFEEACQEGKRWMGEVRGAQMAVFPSWKEIPSDQLNLVYNISEARLKKIFS